jgi:hypothetical protein
MLKKTYTFGLLAAAIIITPGAALATDFQNNQQNINQVGIAQGFGNTVVNNANQQNRQNATRFGNGGYYSCGYNPQAQLSNQNIAQTGVALGGFNTVVNNANQGNAQNILSATNGYCY